MQKPHLGIVVHLQLLRSYLYAEAGQQVGQAQRGERAGCRQWQGKGWGCRLQAGSWRLGLVKTGHGR